MSSFSEALRNNTIKKLAPGRFDENPLDLIGLSHEILELGLTDDELFAYCQKLARTLTAYFHADVRKEDSRSRELQLRFSSAFTLLKDRAVFDEALRAYKARKSEERSELNRVRENLQAARNDLYQAQATIQELKQANKDIAHIKTDLESRSTQTLLVPLLLPQSNSSGCFPYQIPSNVKSLYVLSFNHMAGSKVCEMHELEKLEAEYKHKQQLKVEDEVWQEFKSKLNAAKVVNIHTEDLIAEAVERGELFPSIYWNEQAAWRKAGFAKAAMGFRYPTRADLDKLGLSGDHVLLNQLTNNYRKALRVLSKICPPIVSSLNVELRRYEFEQGRLMSGSKPESEIDSKDRILGGISPEIIGQRLLTLRNNGSVNLAKCLEVLQPWVRQMDVLVLASSQLRIDDPHMINAWANKKLSKGKSHEGVFARDIVLAIL